MPIVKRIHLLTAQLQAVYDDVILCTQYAWWLVQAVTNKSQTQLLAAPQCDLTSHQEEQLRSWVHRMVVDHMPIQYILGTVPFADVDILVRPPVLIPRPETEEWCMWLLHKLKFLHNKNLTIIEPCTGSGCIAIALGHALPGATIYATDISADAVALTRENAERTKVSNVVCIQSDLLAQLPHELKADLIVVNPPYIAESVFETLDSSVTQWEDARALVADNNGLAVIEQIITQAPLYLKHNVEMALHAMPQLMIEIGYDQAAAVVALMSLAHYTAIVVHKDLEGKDRVVSGRVTDVELAISR